MRKIVEGVLSVLVIIGFGYIIYKTFFAKNNRLALLKKDGIEAKGFIYKVGGDDLQVWLGYEFAVDNKPYYGDCDADGSANKGDSIDILYLESDPNINAIKDEVYD